MFLTVVCGPPSDDSGPGAGEGVAAHPGGGQAQRDDVLGAARGPVQDEHGDVVVEADAGELRVRAHLHHLVGDGRAGLVLSLQVHVAQPHGELARAEPASQNTNSSTTRFRFRFNYTLQASFETPAASKNTTMWYFRAVRMGFLLFVKYWR